jgi:ubiquinone/menaquinone biosynthesis C-methylase UbiE
LQDYDWDSDYASGNFRHWEPDSPSPELASLVAVGLIAQNDTILDVGCGGGLDAIFLAQCELRLVGIDLSKRALKLARERADKAKVRIDWIVGSVFDLPFKDGTFDYVTDRGLFHLIEDANRARYNSGIFRVLRRGGRVVIRGASQETGQDRFNPVTEAAIDKAFPKRKWRRGTVVPILLSSCAGTIDARLVILKRV